MVLGNELLERKWCGDHSAIGNMVSVWEYAIGKYGVGD